MSDLRILGKRLGQRIGQEAIVLARITERSFDGMSAKITTTDDVQINVTFPEAVKEGTDYIQVRGTVKSKSTMSCEYLLCIPPHLTKDFDRNGYNTMVNMHLALGNQLEGVFHGDKNTEI